MQASFARCRPSRQIFLSSYPPAISLIKSFLFSWCVGVSQFRALCRERISQSADKHCTFGRAHFRAVLHRISLLPRNIRSVSGFILMLNKVICPSDSSPGFLMSSVIFILETLGCQTNAFGVNFSGRTLWQLPGIFSSILLDNSSSDLYVVLV